MLTNKKLLLFFCTILSLLAILGWNPGLVSAQSDNGLEWINVTVWPEYEKASGLVSYEVQLSDSLDFPQEVAFAISAECEVQNVSIIRADEELLPISWHIHEDGIWQEVNFAAVSPVALVECIQPHVIVEDTYREFSFAWKALSNVDLFSITVYQPYGASELTVVPSLSRVEELGDGRRVYSSDFGSLRLNDEISLEIQYEKDITNPNYPALSVSSASPLDGTISGHAASSLSVVIWLIAVAAVVMILVAIYYWWISRRMKLKKAHVVRGVGILNPEKQVVFCHECGSRSKAGDIYCRSCGTELRRFQ